MEAGWHSDLTDLRLPLDVALPVRVQQLLASANALIDHSTPLLSYAGVDRGQSARVEYASPFEGKLVEWTVKEGQLVTSKETILGKIREVCQHEVQFGGLCAVCGENTTLLDYSGDSDQPRAAIPMSHHHAGLTVSLSEAQRLEAETTKRLLKARKLSLIVDLDQTIIHATVDPTVGEWQKDENNPNHSALLDVSKFKLSSDERGSQADAGWWYYIKPRPGLFTFLDSVSEMYEMHVYTMGTRDYAESVCRIVDPQGKLFSGRILSRDESGSMVTKHLERLFPCDTSMVVVIDDRADVWNHSPNLLKVVPFDFFVGIGDINAAFLPKKKDILDVGKSETHDPQGSVTSNNNAEVSGEDSKEENEAERRAITQAATDIIEHQIADRPLAKKAHDEAARQHEIRAETPASATSEATANPGKSKDRNLKKSLSRESTKSEGKTDSDKTSSQGNSSNGNDTISLSPDASLESVISAVLKENDEELPRIMKILTSIHQEFYEKQRTSEPLPDVKHILPAMKQNVLQGTKIVFSSVIPLGQDPRASEIWRLAESFGAICMPNVDSTTTHVVTAKDGTVKVNEARRRKAVHIVWAAWLLESMALWRHLDESKFTLDLAQTAAPEADGMLSAAVRPVEEPIEESVPSPPPTPSGSTVPYTDAEMGQAVENVDWGAADAEFDDLLAESDGESIGASSKKRARSRTPSSSGEREPASPLQKRVKTALGRPPSSLNNSTSTQSGNAEDSNDDDDDSYLDAMADDLLDLVDKPENG